MITLVETTARYDRRPRTRSKELQHEQDPVQRHQAGNDHSYITLIPMLLKYLYVES